jgi:hypothetical protein
MLLHLLISDTQVRCEFLLGHPGCQALVPQTGTDMAVCRVGVTSLSLLGVDAIVHGVSCSVE